MAALMAAGAVTLKRVAQDGMRIRASAGAASFRRGETLERCLEEARAQVEPSSGSAEEDPGRVTRRQQAARERAARERQERIEQALERLPRAGRDQGQTRQDSARRRGSPPPMPRPPS